MDNTVTENKYWKICQDCNGQGKLASYKGMNVRFRKRKLGKQIDDIEPEEVAAKIIKGPLIKCMYCNGTGLVNSDSYPMVNNQMFHHVAIIGGGIGGVALAVACLHRGIPFTLYERDNGFNDRSQGYGLTLQQASNAIQGFGLFSLEKGVFSTRHVVHTTNGKIIGEWGVRKLTQPVDVMSPKRKNIHIARQALRLALLEQLGQHQNIKWGHQLINFKKCSDSGLELNFKVKGMVKSTKADIIVGADGIRSTVRKLLIGDDITPLCYLGCIVILGICPLSSIQGVDNTLLDSATVFQTANGNERIYIMPYSNESVMWQLSFPMEEENAKLLSSKGPKALKVEACLRTQWHEPVPQIVAVTLEEQISGYPVYDRAPLETELLQNAGAVTLIGDAAHPMSPFKGQGANQALLDALALARVISKNCSESSEWRKNGIRNSVLTEFESEMIKRSASKVKDSATAAHLLHSESILKEIDEPRGRNKNKI